MALHMTCMCSIVQCIAVYTTCYCTTTWAGWAAECSMPLYTWAAWLHILHTVCFIVVVTTRTHCILLYTVLLYTLNMLAGTKYATDIMLLVHGSLVLYSTHSSLSMMYNWGVHTSSVYTVVQCIVVVCSSERVVATTMKWGLCSICSHAAHTLYSSTELMSCCMLYTTVYTLHTTAACYCTTC